MPLGLGGKGGLGFGDRGSLGVSGKGGLGFGARAPLMGASRGPQVRPHGGGGGVGGFFGNLVGDAGNAIAGLPTGVENIGRAGYRDVRHPSNLLHLGAASGEALVDPQAAWRQLGHTNLGRDVIQPIGRQYGQEYGPLVHGHFGQFGHEFYQHPLGPILDAATLATLGAGGIAKAGELASRAGLVGEDARIANLGRAAEITTPDWNGEQVVRKMSSHNPLVRYRQQLVNKALNKLPSETPGFGSTARAVRALQRGPAREAARLDVQARDFGKAWAKLSKPEQAAFHLRARGLDPGSYMGMLEREGGALPAMRKVLEDPKLRDAFQNPSSRLQQALALGREMSDRLTASRVAAGHIDEQTALEAPYRHLRLLSGATIEPVMGESPKLVAARFTRDALEKAHEDALQKEEQYLAQSTGRDLGPLSEEDAQARLAELDKQHEQLVQKTIPHVSPYEREIGKSGRSYSPEQMARNYAKGKSGGKSMLTVSEEERQLADSAIRDAIAKHPDDPAAQSVGRMLEERDRLHAALLRRKEGAIFGHQDEPLPRAPQSAHASVPLESNPFRDKVVQLGQKLEEAHKNVARLEGSKVQTGAVRLAGGKSVEDIIRELEASGSEHPFHIPDTAHNLVSRVRSRFSAKPAGFSAPDQTLKQSRLILARKGLINLHDNALLRDYASYRDKAAAQMLHDELVKHASVIGPSDEIPRGFEEIKLNRGTPSAPYTQRIAAGLEHELNPPGVADRVRNMGRLEEAAGVPGEEGGHRLIVPSQVKRLVEDETKSYPSRLAAIRRVPLNVWKGAVLGLRPAFFGNITIGNSILGTLQMAPGRWGFVGWLNQVMPGFEKVAGAKLDEATMKDVFPEQVSGTFGGSVTPHGYHGPSKVLRAGSKAAQGVMPATIGYENVLRRAMAEGWAKATPEVQALMERNGGDVNAALRSLSKSHPQIVDTISRRIDNALGNYRTYNRFERAIKSVVPFYGWNRHITASIARLASERPAVLDALLNTGEQGKAKADRILGAVPSYLNQAIPVHLPSWLGGQTGAGDMTVLDPHAWNPLSTLTDEAKMLSFPFRKSGTVSDAFPLAPDLQAAIEQLSGKSLLTGAPEKGNALKDELLMNLFPQESLFTSKHPSSARAVNQNKLYAQLLRILGLPVENVNRSNAATAAGPWRTINIPG